MNLNLLKADPTKYITIISLWIIAGCLFFWGQVASLIPLSINQVLGMGLGFLVGAFIYINNQISKIVVFPTVALKHGSLNKCFETVEDKMNTVKHLRIYANTTTNVQPVFANSKINVIKCQLLVREPSEEDEKLKAHIGHLFLEWESLQKKGRIKELEIRRFKSLPTEWQVIFDERYLIPGLNIPSCDDWKGIDIIDDYTLFENSTEETKMFIKRYVSRFDNFFKSSKKERKI